MNRWIKSQYTNGGAMTFLCERFLPLSCEDFVAAHKGTGKTYNIVVDATDIEIFTSGISEPVRTANGRQKLSINFRHSLPVYALVPGGWLPPPFVEPPVFLLDRNVIRHIERITKGAVQDLYSDTRWWLNLIADDRTYLSPFLYAFESGNRMIPEDAEFKSSYEEGVEIIQQLFPKAEVPKYKQEHYDAASETMADVLKFHEQETEFLQKAAPLILVRAPERDLDPLGDEIMKIAGDFGLPLRSLPLLASLSCLYEDYDVTGYNAARDLLKIGGGPYTPEKAYNVLSDMRGLLLYFAFRAFAEAGTMPLISYVTSDQAAMLFGCGLNVTKAEWNSNELILSMELTKFLFPRMKDEKRKELAQRMQEG